MVNRNLVRQFDLPTDELQKELDDAFSSEVGDWLPAEEQEFRDNNIVKGKVRKVTADDVWIDVGYKSEGAVELREWFDEALNKIVPPVPGDTIEVLVEAVEVESVDASLKVSIQYVVRRTQARQRPAKRKGKKKGSTRVCDELCQCPAIVDRPKCVSSRASCNVVYSTKLLTGKINPTRSAIRVQNRTVTSLEQVPV